MLHNSFGMPMLQMIWPDAQPRRNDVTKYITCMATVMSQGMTPQNSKFHTEKGLLFIVSIICIKTYERSYLVLYRSYELATTRCFELSAIYESTYNIERFLTKFTHWFLTRRIRYLRYNARCSHVVQMCRLSLPFFRLLGIVT